MFLLFTPSRSREGGCRIVPRRALRICQPRMWLHANASAVAHATTEILSRLVSAVAKRSSTREDRHGTAPYRRAANLRTGTARSRLLLAATLAFGVTLLTTTVVFAGDGPHGFWYGTDSNAPTATGGSVIYGEPYNSGTYGGYFGEVDTYTDQHRCSSGRAVNWTDVNDANANHQADASSQNPDTMGTALYYYMGGPGADPSYNGSTTEAYNWGKSQAVNAWSRWQHQGPALGTPLIFMDIEQQYHDGWNDVTRGNCQKTIYSYGIPTAVDRATVNGFWDYIYYSTPAYPGVYSDASMWNYTFGSNGNIPNTYEWTFEGDTSSSNGVYAWCYYGTCAQWFGGSGRPVAWQWSIDTTNGYRGDFDQIDMCTWNGSSC